MNINKTSQRFIEVVAGLFFYRGRLPDTLLNERCNISDVLWGDRAHAGIDMQPWNQIVFRQPDLLDRIVALQLEDLVKARANEALLNAITGGR